MSIQELATFINVTDVRITRPTRGFGGDLTGETVIVAGVDGILDQDRSYVRGLDENQAFDRDILCIDHVDSMDVPLDVQQNDHVEYTDAMGVSQPKRKIANVRPLIADCPLDHLELVVGGVS